MNRNQSFGSGSNANANSGMSLMVGEVHCHCGKVSAVKKSWTDDNPWRRFYSCGKAKWRSCNFFLWFDIEKPHGWQKTALLEARDLIREQHVELKKLRALVGHDIESEGKEIESRIEKSELLSEMEKENKKFKQEIVLSNEKEKLFRQFVIISWVGFVGITAVIVNVLK